MQLSLKQLCFFSFFLLFIVKSGIAQIGLGLTNYNLQLEGRIGEVRYVGVGIFNPGTEELKVRIYFDCLNCKKDIKIFGRKIGESILITNFLKLDKTEAIISAHTSYSNPYLVRIYLYPRLFLKKYFIFKLPEGINFFIRLVNPKFSGEIQIPYYTLLIGKQVLNGKLAVDAVRIGVAPSIAATLTVIQHGMPFSSFLLLIGGLALLGLTIGKRIGILVKFKSFFKLKRRKRKRKV